MMVLIISLDLLIFGLADFLDDKLILTLTYILLCLASLLAVLKILLPYCFKNREE